MTYEEVGQLKVRITELERKLAVLIERYNEHWHEVANFIPYGYASYEPKKKFQVR